MILSLKISKINKFLSNLYKQIALKYLCFNLDLNRIFFVEYSSHAFNSSGVKEVSECIVKL